MRDDERSKFGHHLPYGYDPESKFQAEEDLPVASPFWGIVGALVVGAWILAMALAVVDIILPGSPIYGR